ncbi:MAG: hypothetical protein AB1393_09490 [Candidatus Edwardsbacteria bacterium]
MNKLLGNKFVQVPKAFFKVILHLDLPCVAKDILWVLIWLTYGYHKEWRPIHIKEIAFLIGCQSDVAEDWIRRLLRWGVLIRAKCSIKKSKRKYKPRYVYAINPTIRQWRVLKRKRIYKDTARPEDIEQALYLLGDKYEQLFHQPPDETLYNELKELLHFYSPRRLLGVMKKSAVQGMGWAGVVRHLSTQGLGGTE